MKHVLVQTLTEDLPKVSLALAEVGVFAPDPRSAGKNYFPTVPGEKYRELFKQAQARMEKISHILPMPSEPKLHSIRVVEESELERLNTWLGEVWATASSYEEQFRRITEDERLVGIREGALENFANLNVDLGLLHTQSQFLNLLIGTVPTRNIQRLEESLGLAKYILYTFRENISTTNVIIVGMHSSSNSDNELQSVLQAAAFQPLVIPQDLRSQPEKIRAEINSHRSNLVAERQKIHDQLNSWAESLKQDLINAQRTLTLAEPFVRMDKSVRSAGSLGTATGWVPVTEVEKLENTLNDRMSNPFVFTVRDPTHKELSVIPTLMQPNEMLAPYQEIVCQYGVPRYGEVDPTWMFAITFVFMFGVMFGDVGQGAVFVFLSWLFRKSLGHYIRLTVPLGLSSIFFGFMYGSVFGFEDVIINHIWVSPLHSPTYMLAAGVFWGVAFITMVSMVAIYNHYIEGEIMEAVSGHHGIMSLVLYLSIVWGLVEIANGGEFGTIPKYLAILALSAIAAHTWHEMHDSSVIERIMVVIVGFLEIFMGYISNTLSFLRVAAFSVNHAALAMSVFAIAYAVGNTQTTGHWITVVLGNVFIMVLEGAIVAIQTLRLEYYEGFSRYYNGDGLEYQPIKLNLKAGI
jgi:V/A-type H+-transporting ATPase subunit I